MIRHQKAWTNEEDKFLSENYEHMSNDEIGEAIGRTGISVGGRMKILFLSRKTKRDQQYALYKGDEFIANGTMEEIAEHTGVRKKTIFHYSTPAYNKSVEERKYSKNARRLVSLEGKSDE